MIVDYTITIGNMIEIAAMVGGGVLVMIRMSASLVSIKGDVSGMQEEIKELGKVLTQMAVTDTRVAAADSRIANLEQDIRDLRRGKGWITGNFNRSVDGEYP